MGCFVAGMKCPNCGELTLHRTPTGASCTRCQLTVRTPANNGKGGRGLKCPFCKEHTVFGSGKKRQCRGCGAEFSGFED